MIQRTQDGTVTILRMSHGKASALDTRFLVALTAALEAERAGQCRALVLTGTGPIFSAGVDLDQLLEGRPYVAEFIPALNRFLWALAEFDKPLVAAINGHAIAGGCVIACGADRRFMLDEGATIGTPELLVGVPFPPSALEIMRAALPGNSLKQVIYSGQSYGPADALRCGLVDELAPLGDLMAAAVSAASQMASIPDAAFRATKRAIWAPYREHARQDVEQEFVDSWSSREVQASVGEFARRVLGR